MLCCDTVISRIFALPCCACGCRGSRSLPSTKKVLWVIGRQHPGETMASFWMEGFVQRLLDVHDPVSRALLNKVDIYAVPNMNPDGSRLGHLRANAVGVNLNREWDKPSKDKSPEVFHTRAHMLATGCDLSLDIHGDEDIPHCFMSKSAQGVPSVQPRLVELQHTLELALQAANPDFQLVHGYDKPKPGAGSRICASYTRVLVRAHCPPVPCAFLGQSNLGINCAWMAETFRCLALTQEMPFKDCADLPDPQRGYGPARCRALGAAMVQAVWSIVDQL